MASHQHSTRTPRRAAAPSSHGAGLLVLSVGALGVVFGDIGTSPLYAVQTVFALDGGIVRPTPGDVYGVISLVFWSITAVVSGKYVLLVLRADNDGEGGVMALAALARRTVRPSGKRFALVMVLGVVGASLFYGDSVITPAISVMSAIEGLSVSAPELGRIEVPLGATIIAALFVVQRYGTSIVGRFFGPVMIVWFGVLAALGITQISRGPAILQSLLPHHALLFVLDHPFIAFIAMGAVVLAITGAEALYADMGHFGRAPIRRAWFALVFPALTLNYLGQGALILHTPSSIANPFYLMAPAWAQLPLVVLATAATIIASQAVISGAYSVSRQAERLGYLPKLTIRHTSQHEGGQIYAPAINWTLCAGVLLLLLTFQSSTKLATAYGLAVTGTFLLTTTLVLIYAESAWGWGRAKLLSVGVPLGVLEVTYFSANLTKVAHGGWLPLLIAVSVVTVMLTWQRGRLLVTERRTALEGRLDQFVWNLEKQRVSVVPGTAVFLHPDQGTTPLALRENVAYNHVLHEHVFLVRTVSENVPHVFGLERHTWDVLPSPLGTITAVTLRFGFQDEQNVPRALEAAKDDGLDIELSEANYFLSRITLQRGPEPGLARWRKRLFIALAHNAANPSHYFRLPQDRTVVMGAQVTL